METNNNKPNILKAEYCKHMIECKCIHPIFKDVEPTVFHKFIVFSVMDQETCDIKSSYAQCNNCGVIHKIIGIGQSTILKKEESNSIESIDEIKFSLPNHLRVVLEKYDCDLHVWQEVKFIYENELFGRYVILSKEKDGDNSSVFSGKYMIIISSSLFKIETFEQDEGYILI